MKIKTLNETDIETVLAFETDDEVIEWLNGHGYGHKDVHKAVAEWRWLKKDKEEKVKKEKEVKEVKPAKPTA